MWYWIMKKEEMYYANLFVHQHVDHGVVQGWALSEEGRDGCSKGGEGSSLVYEDPGGKSGIWYPSYQEAKDHQDAHACHFPLSLLSGLWLLLLGCSLKSLIKYRDNQHLVYSLNKSHYIHVSLSKTHLNNVRRFYSLPTALTVRTRLP